MAGVLRGRRRREAPKGARESGLRIDEELGAGDDDLAAVEAGEYLDATWTARRPVNTRTL